jgi:RNA polymerase sigma-70 factor (ECF subfamily)
MSVMLPQRAFAARSLSVAALYSDYATLVRRVLRSRGVAPHSLEDATQDVFLVAFRRYDDFVPLASHKTWLFAIAVKVARDHRRRVARKGGLGALQEHEFPCSGCDPFTAVAAAQALAILNRRLERLACERRDVFILAELVQLSAPEIAEVLCVKLNTVYSRLRAARRELGIDTESRAPSRANSGEPGTRRPVRSHPCWTPHT